MLETIHNNRKGVFGIFGVLLVGLMMFGFGMDVVRKPQSQAVIRVDEREVDISEFELRKERLTDAYRQMFGQAFGMFFSQLNIPQATIDQTIDDLLVDKIADTLGLAPSKSEVVQTLVNAGLFKDGVDPEQYRRFLASTGKTAAQFEGDLAADVRRVQLRKVISQLTKISEQEMTFDINRRERKFDVEIGTLESTLVNAPAVTAEQITTYYNEHISDYQLPERVEYTYLEVNLKNFPNQPVSNEDVELYYAENQGSYKELEKFNLEEIRITIPDGAEATKREDLRMLLEGIRIKTANGKPFGELAATHTDNLDLKPKKGATGWIQSGKYAKPLEEAMLKVKEGGVSEVVEYAGAYYLFNVLGYNPARTKSLDEVRTQIESIIRTENAPAFLSEEAHKLFGEWKASGKTLKEFADSKKLIVQATSKPLSADEEITPILKGLTSSILSNRSSNMQIVELKEISILAEINKIHEPDVQSEGAVAPSITAILKKSATTKLLKEKADGFVARLNSGEDFDTLAKEFNLKTALEKDISLSSGKLGVISGAALGEAIRELENRHTAGVINKFYELPDSFAIIRINNITLPTPETVAAKKKELRAQLQGEASTQILNSVIGRLKADADVWISPTLLG